jgi:hypothetical protein
MAKLQTLAHSVFQQVMVEFRLFWRSRQTIYLTFLVPMMGMALFVYLNGEGVLDSAFAAVFRGQGKAVLSGVSPMTLMTLGLVVYCIVDVGRAALSSTSDWGAHRYAVGSFCWRRRRLPPSSLSLRLS